jgi:prepilin-type N-terminal cleavage/methylation domain-containing protein
MRRAFTLIELIFTIVIIGLLAAIAVPKFVNLTFHAKKTSLKSTVATVQSAIDEIHGKWIIDDNFKWEHSLTDEGYPEKLDDGAGTKKLFSYVLKSPIYSCSNKKSGCWIESSDKVYDYYFDPNTYLRLEYNNTSGLLECKNGGGITQEECENEYLGK